MSFFEDASLVLIPSAQKLSKIYSVKPTDGTGDLAFTRSNDTATRVASNGLIEKVRNNLLTYSNDFSNAAWSKYNLTLTSGQTDPNGGTTAFLIQSTSAAAPNFGQVNAAAARTTSIFAKVGTRSNFSILNGGYNNGAQFDLSTQTATAFGVGSLAKIESVGSGWFRCSVFLSSTTETQVMLTDIAGNGGVIGDNLTFAFAQSETGDIATPYIATTTAAVSVGPVANVPRLDYLNSSCPRLLLEPQRTNLVTYSDGLVVAQAFGATLTKNQITSPDGYVNASLLTPLGGAAGITLATASLSGNYTISGYLKGTVAGQKVQAFGDLQGLIATFTLTTSWARYTATFNSTNATGQSIYFLSGSYFTPSENNPFYVYGAQLEAGAYATSYIPTLGASVTRGADAAIKTSISSLIGQTAGTLYAEYNIDGTNTSGRIIAVSDGTTANRIALLNDGASIRVFVASAGVGQVDISFGTWLGSHKIAVAYANNDLVVYLDGVSVATDTSISVPACSAAQVGTFEDNTNATPLGGGVKQALLFKTRLTNAQLAELTTI